MNRGALEGSDGDVYIRRRKRAQKNNFETSISGRARGEMKPLDFRRKKHLTDGNPGKFIF